MFGNKQKKYLKRKIEQTQYMIWDLEFKRYKTLEMRDEIREEHDGLKSRLELIENQLKTELTKEQTAEVEEQKKAVEEKIGKYQAQMEMLDFEIIGLRPNEQYPEGVQGINEQLDALQSLKAMYEEYLEQI